MKIYTKKGDTGKSQIIGESNIYKSRLIFNAIGNLDELNSIIGLCNLYIKSKDLTIIQNTIFLIGSYIALKDKNLFKKTYLKNINKQTTLLEKQIDKMENKLPTLINFILPSGSKNSVYLHMARSITRRCERSIVRLAKTQPIDSSVLKFVNRLSDYFFVYARYCNKLTGTKDTIWKI